MEKPYMMIQPVAEEILLHDTKNNKINEQIRAKTTTMRDGSINK
jgi:hypothetical protein